MCETGCKRCGKELKQPEGRGRRKLFCSRECQNYRAKKQNKCKQCGAPASQMFCTQACGLEYRHDKKRAQTRQCKWCHKAFAGSVRGAYCSNMCAVKGRVAKKLATNAKKRTTNCLACGKEFVARKQMYMTCCSRECGWELMRIRHRKACEKCGVAFNGRGSSCDECSIKRVNRLFLFTCADCGIAGPTHNTMRKRCDQCLVMHHRALRNAASVGRYQKQAGDVKCRMCESVFSVDGHANSCMYCDVCKRKQKGGTHRKRARKYGVKYVPIVHREIFERDGWKCQLCGGKVKRKRKEHYHPLMPVLDHIIPISKGGDHVHVNVQCAHASCNERKGDKAKGQQLRLIG